MTRAPPASWPYRDASELVEVAGVRWHIQRTGAGTPILLLHGTGSSTHSWAPLIPHLQSDHDVLAPDLPGQGFSEVLAGAPYSLGQMADATTALLEHLEFAPQIILGHSAGAALGVALAKRLGAQHLVAVNGAFLPFAGAAGKLFMPLAKGLASAPMLAQIVAWRAASAGAVERLIGATGSQPAEETVRCYRTLFRNPEHIRATLAMMAGWDLQKLQASLCELEIPMLLLVGECDRTVPPSQAFEVARRTPDAEVRTLEGLGHLAHEEAPATIAEHMARIDS